jgi:hypothetical protein
MNPNFKKYAAVLVFTFISNILFAQASLTIVNNSKRTMTVKVMRKYNSTSTKYQTITIAANSSSTVYFSESGTYFTKTKATLYGKDPIYKKGQSFSVTNDSSGYSELTLTFTVKESKTSTSSSGQTISQAEFDKN